MISGGSGWFSIEATDVLKHINLYSYSLIYKCVLMYSACKVHLRFLCTENKYGLYTVQPKSNSS